MRLIYFLPLFICVSALAKPCGLTGTIEERIKDCDLTKGSFIKVAENEKGMEFYKDSKTHLIWGSRIPTDFNHFGSPKACSDLEVSGYQILSSLKWRLPSIKEFEDAAASGMKAALPNSENSYWSSTPLRMKRRRRGPPARAYIWDGFTDKTDTGDLKDGASVRCVAKE